MLDNRETGAEIYAKATRAAKTDSVDPQTTPEQVQAERGARFVIGVPFELESRQAAHRAIAGDFSTGAG